MTMTQPASAPPDAPAAPPDAPAPPRHAPDQSVMRLRELVFGAACAAAIRAAVRLGAADALGEEPATAEELAAAVRTEARPLGRLLRALASYGVFTEHPDGRFAHTAMSRMLREDAPDSLRNIALWCTEPWTWDAWPLLDEAVRTGKDVIADLYGKRFFEYLHDDAPESAAVFNKAMTRSSMQSARDVVDSLDLTGVATVADIGGGNGAVLAEILKAHPNLRGVLVDLAGPARNAPQHLQEEGVRDRAEVVTANLFEPFPVHADAAILCDVLGDWEDADATRLLSHCAEAVSPDGRVLVIEMLPEAGQMAVFTEMDLRMMVYVGGRMRDLDQLEQIVDHRFHLDGAVVDAGDGADDLLRFQARRAEGPTAQDLGVPLDDGERGVEVVGNGGEEGFPLADRRPEGGQGAVARLGRLAERPVGFGEGGVGGGEVFGRDPQRVRARGQLGQAGRRVGRPPVTVLAGAGGQTFRQAAEVGQAEVGADPDRAGQLLDVGRGHRGEELPGADVGQVGIAGVGERGDQSDGRRGHPHHRHGDDVPGGLAPHRVRHARLPGVRGAVGCVRCHVCLTSVVGGGSPVRCSHPSRHSHPKR